MNIMKIIGIIITILMVIYMVTKILKALECLSILEKLPQKIEGAKAFALTQITKSENRVMALADRLEAEMHIFQKKSRTLDRDREEIFLALQDILEATNNIFDGLSLLNVSLEVQDETERRELMNSLHDKLHSNLETVNKYREYLRQRESDVQNQERER